MAGSETSQQLALCMAMADRTIVNDGTIEELRRKVEDLL
jgi:dephospho-CoA kinase